MNATATSTHPAGLGLRHVPLTSRQAAVSTVTLAITRGPRPRPEPSRRTGRRVGSYASMVPPYSRLAGARFLHSISAYNNP
jgi:hypothetical protein